MRGILQLSQLGKMGRAGNAIIQYLWGRCYARRHDLQLQTPYWFGESIWDFNDARIDRQLPCVTEKMFHGIDDAIIPHLATPLCDWDAVGFFQYHTSYYKPDAEFIKAIFATPNDESFARVFQAAERLRAAKKTVGVHIRRGDFGVRGTPFYLTPLGWYAKLLREIVDPDTTVFFASDDPKIAEMPLAGTFCTAQTLGVETSKEILQGCAHLPEDLASENYHALDFFPDWWLLGCCDTVLIPGNSTFSFSAAMCSPYCKRAYRANPDKQAFEPIDIWDSFPSQWVDHAKYAEIPGLYNPA